MTFLLPSIVRTHVVEVPAGLHAPPQLEKLEPFLVTAFSVTSLPAP